jgi:hypothetical protein
MAGRRLARVPVWARVSLVVALILIGVVASTVALNATGVGDDGGSGGRGHGSGGGMTTMDHDGAGGNHGSGDRTPARDHGGTGDPEGSHR